MVGLPEKVQALSRGANDSIETHMSWVFLTAHHAYKLKKPVRYDYLDFSTLEKRRIDCEVEVMLNRRLAREVYLGTVPLTQGREGTIEIDGSGEIIDWLVWMRRLPHDRTLELAIARHRANTDDIRAAAEMLARFYRDAAPRPLVDPVERTFDWLDENRRELLSLSPAGARIDRAIVPLLRWLEHNPKILEERGVVDGHGDLRPEHVFLLEPPAIIDCIEFNQTFRELDPVSDLSFLALECERLGAAGIGATFLETHRSIARDDPSPQLVHFYLGLHAGTRAKIALWHLREPDHRDPRTFREKAGDYLDLAAAHAARLEL